MSSRRTTLGLPLAVLSVACCLAPGCATRREVSLGTPEERLAPYRARDAEAPPLPEGPLTLQDAIALALAVNPDVVARVAAVKVAEESLRATHDRRDPELRASYTGGDLDSDTSQAGSESETSAGGSTALTATNATTGASSEDREGYQLALRLFPANPWARAAAVSAAEANLCAEQSGLQALRTEVAVLVRQAWEDLRYLDADLVLVRQVVEARRQVLNQARAVVQQGVGTLLDGSSAASRYLRSVSELNRLQKDRERACDELAKLLAIPPERVAIDAGETIAPSVDLFTIDAAALEERAMLCRADLAELGWRRLAAEAAWREARAQLKPWLSYVELGYAAESRDETSARYTWESDYVDGVTRRTSEAGMDETDSTSWEISTAIVLPVFSWFNRADDVRLAELRAAEAVEAAAIEKMRRDMHRLVAQTRSWAEYRRQVESVADPVLAELRDLCQSPAFESMPPQDSATVRDQLLDAERLRLDLDHEARQAVIDLEGRLGTASLVGQGASERR